MSQEIIQITVRNPLIKILLVLLLVAAGVWSYFTVRWYLGNMVAEYLDPSKANFDVARGALAMAPNDPLTHWRLAELLQKNLPLDQQAQAIPEFERAVSLSPNDYRFWISLGTAYERVGESKKAEEALKRAVSLAPSYAYPHWFLGNLLLRNARYDEAFTELRLAGEADPELQPQQFNLIWQVYGNDYEALKTAVGQSSSARAAFALYLLSQKQFDDGLRIWNSLSNEEKRASSGTAEALITSLTREFKFHDALKLWNDVSTDKYHAELDHVFDGGFEEDMGNAPESVFGWQVRSTRELQIEIDPGRSHNGAGSLRLVFRVRADLNMVNVSQLLAVQPKSGYDFECYVSTDNLETASAPRVEIFDPISNTVLVSSATAPGGTNDWNRISLSFNTSEKTEAVLVRITRVSCSDKDTPVCPIFGSVWYDDFNIKRRN